MLPSIFWVRESDKSYKNIEKKTIIRTKLWLLKTKNSFLKNWFIDLNKNVFKRGWIREVREAGFHLFTNFLAVLKYQFLCNFFRIGLPRDFDFALLARFVATLFAKSLIRFSKPSSGEKVRSCLIFVTTSTFDSCGEFVRGFFGLVIAQPIKFITDQNRNNLSPPQHTLFPSTVHQTHLIHHQLIITPPAHPIL